MFRPLPLLTVVVLAGLAHAEGVEGRAGLGSTEARLRGASTLRSVGGGTLVTYGGATLRALRPGTKAWEAVHTVQGDNLYRLDGDATGRLLAAWETEPVFHLFTPGQKADVTYPKPTCPWPEVHGFHLQDLFFLPGGHAALVFMEGDLRGAREVTVAFRVSLDGPAEPRLLFRQDGYPLWRSARGAVFAVPRDLAKICSHERCDLALVVGYEVADAGVTPRTLYTVPNTAARRIWLVEGSTEAQLALVIDLHPPRRHALLTWRYGDTQATYRPFVEPLPSQPALLLEGDHLLQVRRLEADPGEHWTRSGLEVRRLTPEAKGQALTLPPFPPGDPDASPDAEVHDVGFRQDGQVWVHWGNHLVLLPPGAPPKAVDLEPLLKRRNEWGGVDVYVAEPEGLWLAIEVGAGRDFVHVPFADLEKRAKPWAAPAAVKP